MKTQYIMEKIGFQPSHRSLKSLYGDIKMFFFLNE